MISSIIQAFLIKILPNMSEQKKKWQRIYDLLNTKSKENIFCRKELFKERRSCCCCWRIASETSALDGVVQPKRLFGSLPNFSCPERRSGMNRISHPDWVKLCVELSYAPNQNTNFPSATNWKSTRKLWGQQLNKI